MSYIPCVYGGGGTGGTEVIDGTIAGAVNTEWTVTSQQGKAPKIGIVYMSSPAGATTSGCYWNANYQSNKHFGQYLSSGTTGTTQNNVGTSNNYTPNVKAVGANSITFRFGSSAAYVNGTFTYHVEFE